MATSFDTVIDMALTVVDDYSLVKLYNNSEDSFYKFCDGLLISAIPNFFRCRQSLEYDAETREFVSDLTATEVSILADFWNIAWMERKTNNSSQFQAKLQSSGSFKNHSEAQNLKEKMTRLDEMREKVYQKIMDYQLQDTDSIDLC